MDLRLLKTVTILGVIGGAWFLSDGRDANSAGDPVVTFAATDQTINDAQDEARRTLPKFLEAMVTDTGQSQRDTLVKVAFPIDANDAGVEVIWVGNFRMDGENFFGQLANEPVNMPGFHAGSDVAFSQDMIRDWIMPSADGRAFGHYTTRVIAAQSGDANFQKTVAQMLTPNPAPEGW